MGFAALPLASKLAIGAMAAGSLASAYNTRQTAKRQDAQAAQSIRNQADIQRRADAKVNEHVAELQGSNAEGERKQRMADYMAQLTRNRSAIAGGLQPGIGGDAFQSDAQTALEGVDAKAMGDAGLLARMDAAGMQRQREGTAAGKLGTDIGMIGRESKGQQFIDELRLRGIRRNGGLDLASGLLGAVGSGMAAGGGGLVGNPAGVEFVDIPTNASVKLPFSTPGLVKPPRMWGG